MKKIEELEKQVEEILSELKELKKEKPTELEKGKWYKSK